MRINVSDILAEEVGYRRTYSIANERPSFESVKLTKDIEGEITVSRLDSTVVAAGRITTELELECHRCLNTFTTPATIRFSQAYSEKPMLELEEQPIEAGGIDLAPVIEEELLVNLPIKILCREDCPGVPGHEAEYTSDKPSNRLGDTARIMKGK